MSRFALLSLALIFACNGKDDKDSALLSTGTVPGTGTVTGTGTPPGETTPLTGTPTVDTCGDYTLDPGEGCDFGPMNAADGNCLLNCTLSEHQRWTVSIGALPGALVDAEGVAYADAPVGAAAWKPADADLNGDGLAKLELSMPLYDPRMDPGFIALQIPDFPLDKIAAADPIGTILLSEIQDITFDARFPAGQAPKFYLYMYTQPDGIDDQAAWYGYRLYAPTAVVDTPAPVADTWIRYSVAGPDSQFRFRDATSMGTMSGHEQPLSTLTATTTFNWADVDGSLPVTSINYGAEAMKYVSIQTSSGTGTTEFDGAIDRLFVTLTDGRTFQLDFEL